MNRTLTIPMRLPITAQNGGLFVSRGLGIHPDRTIDSHELIIVRSGLLTIQEEDRPFRVGANEALLLFPQRRHFGTNPYTEGLSFYWFHFDVTSEKMASSDMAVPQQVRLRQPDEAMTLCRRVLNFQESGEDDERGTHRSLLMMLLLAEVAASGQEGSASDTSAATALAARADALLRVRFGETDLSTHRVAAALGCNPDYLGRIYRRVYGKPLTDALHEWRLRHARYLLLDTTGNVNEIARSCGYSDAGYFRRLFKQHVGVTPQGFRRLHTYAHIITI